jgi:hypothetical protein
MSPAGIYNGLSSRIAAWACRSDIYNGRPIAFVPFTKLQGDVIQGTH